MNQTVSMSRIKVVPGFNPRTYFDEEEMRELETTIAQHGVIEPIVVRPNGEDFDLIAGERRLRAARNVFGPSGEIPVTIKVCTLEAARAMAIIENKVRADNTPVEQADSARDLLAALNGNEAETAKQLGWSIETLKSRLALCNLTANCKVALNERKLKLGHAELLAALPADVQDKTLPKILDNSVTVAVLKQQMGQITRKLGSAIFDKVDCATCQYNSDLQASMFAEAVDAGHCTNKVCFEQKTGETLEGIRRDLQVEVPRVELVTAEKKLTIIPLRAEGSMGVGQEQAVACRSCGNFGATVSGIPGKLGTIERSICFDADCNTTKVAARIEAEKAIEKAGEEARKTALENGEGAEAAEEAGKKAKATAKEAVAVKHEIGTLSSGVIAYRDQVWRSIAAKALFADKDLSLKVLIGLCATHNTRLIDSSKTAEAVDKLCGIKGRGMSAVEFASSLDAVPHENVMSAIQAIAPGAMKTMEIRHVANLLAKMAVDMASYWQVNSEFFDCLTKSQIWAVSEQIGLREAMGRKAFDAAMKLKSKEFIDAILKVEGFAYKGAIPTFMDYAGSADKQAENN